MYVQETDDNATLHIVIDDSTGIDVRIPIRESDIRDTEDSYFYCYACAKCDCAHVKTVTDFLNDCD